MVKEDLLDDIIKESAPYQSPGESANLLTSHDMICTMVSIGAIVVLLSDTLKKRSELTPDYKNDQPATQIAPDE